jgi:hypothetical protein
MQHYLHNVISYSAVCVIMTVLVIRPISYGATYFTESKFRSRVGSACYSNMNSNLLRNENITFSKLWALVLFSVLEYRWLLWMNHILLSFIFQQVCNFKCSDIGKLEWN